MTSERWQKVSRLYHDAGARPAAERERFVREAAGSDAELARQVLSLLAESPGDSILDMDAAALASSRGGSEVVAVGTRLGRFNVRGLLGAGGMGRVYRAHDDSLGRDVAIKILPPQFLADRDRLARFEREARLLATLNHPNIAAIYGVEAMPDAAGRASALRAMILELVEGETLDERIRRGPLESRQALDIASQLTEALEAAHEKGIVHRDLKPANIRIRPDGVVKVLDFGLSKAFGAEGTGSGGPGGDGPVSTIAGIVLGTPGYMSPEQARGQTVDRRTDIWAFGCVLFEMMTGAPAFGGVTPADTIGAVLHREPDWSALPATTPWQVRRVLERCLVKDPRQRVRDIADVRADLQESTRSSPPAARVPVLRALPWAIAVAAIAAATWLAVERWTGAEPAGAQAGTLERITYESGLTTMPAVAPDGQLVAYASDRSGRGDLDIWVRQTGGGPPLRLTTDEADDHWPHFSPDGKQIVFRSERAGGGIYLVPALGGPERLVASEGRNPRFSPDGTRLAYWTGQFRGPASTQMSALFVIPLAGGAPDRIAADFAVTRDPVWAPDGRSLLFLGRRDFDRPVAETFDWWWAPLDGRPPIKTGMFATGLLRDVIAFQGDGSPAAWTTDGVLFTAEANLWMVPLSADTGLPGGPPRRLTTITGRAEAPSMAGDGSIVFAVTQSQRSIERIPLSDAAGNEARVLYADNRSTALRASITPDGATMVFDQGFETYREIWIQEMSSGRRQMLSRVTAAFPGSPTISPDGRRVAYRLVASQGEEQAQGFVIDVAGGVPRPLCERCAVYAFLADSQRVLATWDNARSLGTIDVRDGSRVELARDDGGLDRPHASPDERWLAFRHRKELAVYVTRLTPGRAAAREQWYRVDQPTTTGRPAGWSLDSTTLYTLLDTDGFRCIWGQRIDPVRGAEGGVFPVRHLHVQMDNGPSTSFSNPVTPDGFVYERVSRTGDLWRLAAQ
jgi:Tol biopolymer transport system component